MHEPVTVTQGTAFDHPGVVAGVVGSNFARGLEIAREHLVGLPAAGRRTQKLDEHVMGFGGVDSRPRTIAEPCSLLHQEIGDSLDAILNAAVDLGGWVGEHDRDLVLPQRFLRRCRQAARGVPRIVGRPVNRIEGLPVGEHDRHVGFAEEGRSGLDEAVHRQCVALRKVVLELRQPPGGRHTNHVEGLFDRHRHAMERAPRLASGQGFIGCASALARGFQVRCDDRTDPRVVGLYPCKIQFQQLLAADPASADARGERLGGLKCNFVRHLLSPVVVRMWARRDPVRQRQAQEPMEPEFTHGTRCLCRTVV
jgi:hypothetical protein